MFLLNFLQNGNSLGCFEKSVVHVTLLLWSLFTKQWDENVYRTSFSHTHLFTVPYAPEGTPYCLLIILTTKEEESHLNWNLCLETHCNCILLVKIFIFLNSCPVDHEFLWIWKNSLREAACYAATSKPKVITHLKLN